MALYGLAYCHGKCVGAHKDQKKLSARTLREGCVDCMLEMIVTKLFLLSTFA